MTKLIRCEPPTDLDEKYRYLIHKCSPNPHGVQPMHELQKLNAINGTWHTLCGHPWTAESIAAFCAKYGIELPAPENCKHSN